jgi:hypothetical protein
VIALVALLAFTVHGGKPEELATLTPEQRALYEELVIVAHLPPAEAVGATFELAPIEQEVLPALDLMRAAISKDGHPIAETRLIVRKGGANLFLRDARRMLDRNGRRWQVDSIWGCPASVEADVQRLRASRPTHTWRAEQEIRKRGCTWLTSTLTDALLGSDTPKQVVPVLLRLSYWLVPIEVLDFTFVRKKDAVTARGAFDAAGATARFELLADEDGFKLTTVLTPPKR